MQHAVNAKIEDEVFSMWFAYIHFWAMDMFYMDLPQDYVSNPVVNQNFNRQRRRVQLKIVSSCN
jgi:hypothetical protein